MSASRRVVLALSTVFCVRGGIQRFNQLLCRAFDDLAPDFGYEGTVLSQDDGLEHYEAHGEPWKHLTFVPGGGTGGVAARTLAACVRERPELLLIGHLGMTPIGPACLPFVRGGFGFVAHGTEAWSIPRWSRRFAVRRASRIWVVSRYTGRLLAEAAGIDSGRIRLLPNALEPGLDAENGNWPPLAGRPELLSVARLDADEGRKGIDETIRALPRLIDRHPGVIYRVVGKGTDKARLIELARSTGMADRVVFEEDLSDDELVERYRRCTAFVLPSGQEGFGIVFLEAMRFGKACIGGDAGGTPEVIADGETGLLVPFGDVDALLGAADRLLSDTALCAAMGRRGRQRVRERFVYPAYRDRVARHVEEWLSSV